MALERESIEKKDFPIGPRGYDPAAVDAHLSALADEVDRERRSDRSRTESLATAAGEDVRKIVEAAETSASEIQRRAEEEAKAIRAQARSEAGATRKKATIEAKEYLSKVSESTTSMLQRIEAMQSELGALWESLGTGSSRLRADLELFQRSLDELTDVLPRPAVESEPEEPVPAGEREPEAAGDVFAEQAEPEVELPESSPAEAEAVGRKAGDGADDTEGARLIALNMALSGTPREETDRYLAENYKLIDRDALLDEVYASIDG